MKILNLVTGVTIEKQCGGRELTNREKAWDIIQDVLKEIPKTSLDSIFDTEKVVIQSASHQERVIKGNIESKEPIRPLANIRRERKSSKEGIYDLERPERYSQTFIHSLQKNLLTLLGVDKKKVIDIFKFQCDFLIMQELEKRKISEEMSSLKISNIHISEPVLSKNKNVYFLMRMDFEFEGEEVLTRENRVLLITKGGTE